MNFGSILANNQEEAKHIIELFNFKVQEREKKDGKGNRSTRAICTPRAAIKARAVLPSYVVEYLDLIKCKQTTLEKFSSVQFKLSSRFPKKEKSGNES